MKKLINFYKRLSFFQGAAVATSLTSVVGIAASVSGLHSFTPGTTISSTQMNTNFTILKNAIESTSSQQYVGTYNAASGIYPAAAAIAGDYYIVSTPGTISSITYAVGDWIIYNGSSWSKIPSSATITSVYGRTGAIAAVEGDYTLDQLFDVDLMTTPPIAGDYLRYNGSHWVADDLVEADPSVMSFAKMSLPTCAAGEVLKSSGSSLMCVTDNAGAPAFTGTANRVVTTTGAGGSLAISPVTSTELGYLSGVTSPLQTQINGKQTIDTTLNAIAAYNTNGILVQTAVDTFTGRSITGTLNRLIVTNSDGVSGNPTIDIPTALLPSPVAGDTGKFLKATAANTSVWTALASSDVTTSLGFTPINKAGDSISAGIFNFNGAATLRTLDPVSLTDVANKQYVDSFGQWNRSGADIFFNSGNVGIGTSTPTQKLHVVGSTKLDGNIVIAPGSSSLPSITSSTGPSTGLFFPAANTIGLSINGMERLRIDSSGNLGLGTTTPAYTLHVNGQVAGSSAFITSSDLRYKKEINGITNPLEKLLAIKGVSYKFRNDEFPESKFSNRRELGVIAQNVEKVFPEAVSKDPQGFRSVAYTMLISPIIEAIREVNSKTKRLEDENKMLKSYLCERDPAAPFCE